MALLFSYGTLRDPAVQRSVFGRELDGRADRIVGFRVERLEITDPEVLAVSGETFHPILVRTDDSGETVEGSALEVTEAELLLADGYEVDDYHRVAAPLASGDTAWVYVARD
ncbi:gamma-glutamylcyclotransferase [Actinoplanes sichuanensis]|uniref:Gamma-glutamylcyclotransferase family protein n=1 Tax=Actinoplanes sichuanensis TaxID=512349 RepID=A0ABW4AQZ9_9ACTN|nr:gamma-glutamylcyclotransferase family protein [Actinoplanes sichuanensis]BEL07652.1 gamma-glutamylcyclotransferase [Actinoplanes sichuanensis]